MQKTTSVKNSPEFKIVLKRFMDMDKRERRNYFLIAGASPAQIKFIESIEDPQEQMKAIGNFLLKLEESN